MRTSAWKRSAQRCNDGSISDYVKALVWKDVRHFAMA